jgi:hypothetical protein
LLEHSLHLASLHLVHLIQIEFPRGLLFIVNHGLAVCCACWLLGSRSIAVRPGLWDRRLTPFTGVDGRGALRALVRIGRLGLPRSMRFSFSNNVSCCLRPRCLSWRLIDIRRLGNL